MRITTLSHVATQIVAIAAISLALSACAGNTTKDTKASTPTNTVAQAPKAQDSTATQTHISCTKSPDTRVLMIEPVTPKGCRLQYTRYGHTGPVAWSYVGNSYCEKVRTRIVGKLEKVGYKCGDAASAKTAETTNTNVKKD